MASSGLKWQLRFIFNPSCIINKEALLSLREGRSEQKLLSMSGGLEASRKKINLYVSCSGRPPRKSFLNYLQRFSGINRGFLCTRQPSPQPVFQPSNSNRIISVFICVIHQKYLRGNSLNNLGSKMKAMFAPNTLLWRRKISNQEWSEWASARRWELTEGNDFFEHEAFADVEGKCWRCLNYWEYEVLSGLYICLRANSENKTFVSRREERKFSFDIECNLLYRIESHQ